ncbi:MAG: hypothetical protein AMXMBFR13_30120 [Phycisphaerae bacterium]
MADSLPNLLDRARQSDPSAVAELVERFGPPARRLAAALVGGLQDAEDIVQDSFVTALARLGDLREPEAFPAWLRQIVRRRAGGCLRRFREHEQAIPPATAASLPSPLEDLEWKEQCERVREALRRLPPAGRETAEMFYLDERSIADVAAALDVPAGTVKRRLHDARRRLRVLLAPIGIEPPPEAGSTPHEPDTW